MTIEQKALELVNAERLRRGWYENSLDGIKNYGPEYFEALCRALEAHEADKARHAAELREQAERFSEAVKRALAYETQGAGRALDAVMVNTILSPFILAPVDPLAECFAEIGWSAESPNGYRPDRLRAALEARGLAIVKKEAVNG